MTKNTVIKLRLTGTDKQAMETLIAALYDAGFIAAPKIVKPSERAEYSDSYIVYLDAVVDADNTDLLVQAASQAILAKHYQQDKSFTAHDDAVSDGCVMCGNEWKSLNKEGRCSTCQQIWES